jgi:hypothetical protein
MGVTMVSALAAAIVAAAAPSTAAKLPPAFAGADSIRTHIHVVRLHDDRSRTCSARAPRERAGTIERQLNPVACEQPPRSRVVIAFTLTNGLGALFGH